MQTLFHDDLLLVAADGPVVINAWAGATDMQRLEQLYKSQLEYAQSFDGKLVGITY